MKCWTVGFDGARYELPTVLEWEFRYGLGSPCDSFEVTCLWEQGQEKLLAGATRFMAEEGNERVFTGVVDEYACVRDSRGSRLELSGRGMQALLLDNEALPAEYQLATVNDILRRHVTPYGITLAGTCALGAVAGFSVATGQSEWSVVRDFACCHGGIVPRFDREGRLVLSPWEETGKKLNGSVPITALRYGQKRYGVLSQVVVRDKARKRYETVDDSAFQKEGGMCRRVVTMPGRSTDRAMRYSGAYQLQASQAERETCELTVPQLFAAWPGELMETALGGFGGNGTYRVRETAVGENEHGRFTRMVLGAKDLLV